MLILSLETLDSTQRTRAEKVHSELVKLMPAENFTLRAAGIWDDDGEVALDFHCSVIVRRQAWGYTIRTSPVVWDDAAFDAPVVFARQIHRKLTSAMLIGSQSTGETE